MQISNQALQCQLQELSQPSADFFILLSAATVIASLGLIMNNQAVIIGAMIVAPMMNPLMSLSFAGLVGDHAVFYRSALTITGGSLLSIFIAFCLAFCFGSPEFTREIIARVQPTWFDLGIAICAGAVSAYCRSKKSIGDTLAGVSIAVALVPPLAVIGIGLAHHSLLVSSGAALLYLINLVGITISSVLVFYVLRLTSSRLTKNADQFDSRLSYPTYVAQSQAQLAAQQEPSSSISR